MIRKNATLTAVIFSIIIVLAFFTGMYLYLNENAVNSGITIDSKYNDTYSNISSKQEELSNITTDIRDAFSNVTEPKSIYSVAFYGLTGFLDILRLPLKVVDIAGTTFQSLNILIEIPLWARVLILLSITTLIILILVAIFKGEQKI